MRVAVIGSGISGLSAALLLSRYHDVHLIEKDDRFGGHSRTLEVSHEGQQQPVDTGFIVFNRRNYPWLCKLFNWLEVPTEKSSMSFAVSIKGGWLEYGTSSLSAVFAQCRNILRPRFWKMLRDIGRFNRMAPQYLDHNPDLSLGEALDEMRLGNWFRDYYLLAMGSAIWSTPASKMLEFPASSFIRFFQNHGLLNPADKLQWYTVKGGSRVYVSRILEKLSPQNLHLGVNATLVSRTEEGVVLEFDGQQQEFDQLVLACHSDQALDFLGKWVTPQESELLGALQYQSNRVILHQDGSFLPKRKSAWQSWVYLCENDSEGKPSLSMSYWMNKLQNFSTDKPVVVTLNPDREPASDLVLDCWTAHHPRFDGSAISAQLDLDQLQGQQSVWFCGAWTGYGFHEDGIRSAVRVAQHLGVDADQEWHCA